MSGHVAIRRWAPRCFVLGRAHIYFDMGAPCLLASHRPSSASRRAIIPKAALTSGRARRGGRRGRAGTPSDPTESRAARRGTRLPECEGRRRPRQGRHSERDVILVRRAVVHRAHPLVYEELDRSGGVDRPSRPLGLGRRTEQALVEAPRSVNVVREERDLDELAHVAISNSRSTSFSEVLRSVEALRSPTMSAQGSS